MQKYDFFVGIDIAKATFDVVATDGAAQHHRVFDNTGAGVTGLLRYLRGELGWDARRTGICMEHTGRYNYHLRRELYRAGAAFHEVSGAVMRAKYRDQRGKTDKVDAARIADYLRRYADELRAYAPMPGALEDISILIARRDRLVDTRTRFNNAHTELKTHASEAQRAEDEGANAELFAVLKRQIKAVDQRLSELLRGEEKLQRMAERMRSVPGVGPQTVYLLLLATHGFQRFDTARQLACHCGVVPFAYSSGSSVYKRARVSQRADKRAKQVLTMAAWSAIRMGGRFGAYYERLLERGKAPLSALNAVRNKLLHTIYAVVKNEVMYEENHQPSYDRPKIDLANT